MPEIVVVGAGQAGASLTARLRSSGYDGGITLIGEEPVLPYQRPPLTKGYLLGDMPLERLYLRPGSFYQEQDIVLRTGVKVTAIDPVSRTVVLGDERLGYDQLALATGSRPRLLPESAGGSLAGVHEVRSLEDVDALAPDLSSGARLLVVGGGYIGLEVAAVASKRGVEVTVVEMADRILQRVAAPETSDYIRELHLAHGVDIRESVGVKRLTGDGRISGAVLTDGARLDVDVAVVGVGIAPDISLAEAAGIDVENGVRTDALGRTSVPEIWAAGDCASFPYRGGRVRLESVQNAIDQAETVADNMTGLARQYDPVPWFWSDQYDAKLQIAGLNSGYDEIVSRIAEPGRRASFWYFRRGSFLAVDAINDPRAYMVGKRMLEIGKTPDRAVLSDPDSNLKAMLR